MTKTIDNIEETKEKFQDAFDDVRVFEIPEWLIEDKSVLGPKDKEGEYLIVVGAETEDAIGIQGWMTANAAERNMQVEKMEERGHEVEEIAKGDEFSDVECWIPKSQIEEV